jgi:hypothetical protein
MNGLRLHLQVGLLPGMTASTSRAAPFSFVSGTVTLTAVNSKEYNSDEDPGDMTCDGPR